MVAPWSATLPLEMEPEAGGGVAHRRLSHSCRTRKKPMRFVSISRAPSSSTGVPARALQKSRVRCRVLAGEDGGPRRGDPGPLPATGTDLCWAANSLGATTTVEALDRLVAAWAPLIPIGAGMLGAGAPVGPSAIGAAGIHVDPCQGRVTTAAATTNARARSRPVRMSEDVASAVEPRQVFDVSARPAGQPMPERAQVGKGRTLP
jgi:hypothetical protein